MTDRVSIDKRSAIMRAVKGKDTTPELAVRRMLHRMGLRFRLHAKALPGTPDIVMKRHSLVIFVHGCFWHGHDCGKGKLPKSNRSFWERKIERNRERDRKGVSDLRRLGWRVAIVWQCRIGNMTALRKRLARLVEPDRKLPLATLETRTIVEQRRIKRAP
jgi:DNA mismatch endonuclease, patch repair protein